jgi:hypothetical protein
MKKAEWQGMDWLQQSLRIEYESIRQITSAEIRTLKLVYKHQRVIQFLDELARELGND